MRKQFIKDHRPYAFYGLFYVDFLVMAGLFSSLFLNFGAISQTFEKIGPELGGKMKFKNPKSVN